jgi:dTDP-4-amino-4,6-dideoxy-D-glucose transaminase
VNRAGRRAKHSISDLALYGGQPAFPEPLLVGVPNVVDRDRFLRRVGQLLDRRWLSNRGPLVHEFESRIADLAGVAHAVTTCNATAALQLALAADGVTGEVVVPSFTFPATPHAVRWLGLRPVFADVLEDGTLDPRGVAAAIGPLTSAVLAVHLWGRPCRTAELARVTRDAGVALYYDAAHALGCSSDGRMIGGFGRAEVFSFHATKFVNSFEGGALVTDDAELAERVRLMSNFGITGEDEVGLVGTNAKMSEVCAAMGLASFDTLPTVVARNEANYEAYCRGLAAVPGVEVLAFDRRERNNYQYVVLDVAAAGGLDRDRLARILRAENVVGKRYFAPGCHRTAAYRSVPPLCLPVTEALSERLLVMPTGMSVTPEQVAGICRLIEQVVAVARTATVPAAFERPSA